MFFFKEAFLNPKVLKVSHSRNAFHTYKAYAVKGSSFQCHAATKHLKNLTEILSISFYFTFINCNVIFFF